VQQERKKQLGLGSNRIREMKGGRHKFIEGSGKGSTTRVLFFSFLFFSF